MKQYFAISGFATQPKNALQKVIQEFVKKMNGTLINDVSKFQKAFNEAIDGFNKIHARCRPERSEFWCPGYNDTHFINNIANTNLTLHEVKQISN